MTRHFLTGRYSEPRGIAGRPIVAATPLADVVTAPVRLTLVALLALSVLCVAALFGVAPISQDPKPAGGLPATLETADSLAALPLRFEPNRGQTDPTIDFVAHGRRGALFLSDGDAILSFERSGQIHATRMQLVGSNSGATATGEEIQVGRSNYFRGREPDQWITDVEHYSAVRYSAVYSGIDLRYYGSEGELEYDFILQPSARPSQIALAFEGSSSLAITESGDLEVGFGDGRSITFSAPVSYQAIDGRRLRVESRYLLNRDHVTFAVGEYDPALPLVIDPILEYSTYLGGADVDQLYDVVGDATGASYVVGGAKLGYPTTSGAYQEAAVAGFDVVVTKVAPDGQSLVYSTFIGGGSDDLGYAIAVDGSGNAYITGETGSDDYPTTAGAFDTSRNGLDAFVTKLAADGSSLSYSTFLGGQNGDRGDGIAVDDSGNAYVAGYTLSLDFPTQVPMDGNLSGSTDGFVTKVNAAGSGLVYSTYLGGSGLEEADGIVLDGSNQAWVTGFTASTDFPTTANTYRPTRAETSRDVFISQLNAAGSAVLYGTYVGGTSQDEGYGIDVDTAGNVYVTGIAQSGFPATAGAWDTTFASGNEIFVARFDPSLVGAAELIYSGFLGDSGLDEGTDIAVDAFSQAHVVGRTQSDGLATGDGYDQTRNGQDAVMAIISADGSTKLYATYLGGSGDDRGHGIDLTGSKIHVAGYTNALDFPLVNAYDSSASSDEGWLVRFEAQPASPGSYQISGTVFEDIAGDVLNDGTIGDANNPYAEGVDVYLYDGVSALVGADTTDASGYYEFTGLADDDYTVRVDSRTVPSAQDPAAPQGDIWATQTYGPTDAQCANGTGSAWIHTAPGPCYGGLTGDMSDSPTFWNHRVTLNISGADVTNVDFGFSFNVVVNTRGGDATDDDLGANRTVQGSLRQFIQNANAISGPNIMRFVPVEPTDGTNGTQDWWTIPVTVALPASTDAASTLNGIAFDLFTVTGDRNPNPLGPELELNGSGVVTTGLEIQGGGSQVRNLTINRFSTGIELTGGGSNTIAGNYIGTNATGDGGLVGNSTQGVLIDQSTDNVIGGSAAGDRNLISGNRLRGVNIDDWSDGAPVTSSGTQILGNYVGLDRTGTARIPYDGGGNYQQIGVYIVETTGTVIGTASTGNVLSGNDWHGVYMWGPNTSGNTVENNIVGLDATGSADLGNLQVGVQLHGGPNSNTIGPDNVISGNDDYGIDIINAGSDGNSVVGNYIGTDITGTVDRGNGTDGVAIRNGAQSNVIGGTTAAARNIISGNENDGVWITGSGTESNVVQGNWIGVGADGSSLGNSYHGVAVEFGAANNLVGGTANGAGNRIENSAWDGIAVANGAGAGNSLLGNAIVANTGLGIDYDNDGVTANGLGLLNYPVITSAVGVGAALNVEFDLDVAAGNYRIEFFGNTVADPSGNGEGEDYLDRHNIVGHSGGQVSYSASVSGFTGGYLTATATEGTSAPFGSTSEFSASVAANAAPVITLPGGAVDYTEGDPATVLDPVATLTDSDSPDFDGGTLTVDLVVNGTPNDRLGIQDQGSGAGKISLIGNAVYYDAGSGAVQIGTFTGGTNGSTPLVVAIDAVVDADADLAAVQALLRAITYENVVALPSTIPRTARFELTDGDGGTSNAPTKAIEYDGLNNPVQHEYFVPIPDEQVRAWAVAIDQGAYPPSSDMRAVVSLTVTLDGNRIVFDHWEDGLEANPSNPVQATTEIWGDGRAATGCPPTKNRLPLTCSDANDVLDAGDVLALENDVPASPRGTAQRFDGGDLVASDALLAVTRAGWPVNVGTFSGVVLAGAVEVYVNSDWGTEFEAPVGQDVAGNDMFEYTAFSVMAGTDSTMVAVDVDADGTVDIAQTLDRGESLLAESVLIGGTVSASKPVQVDLLTGDMNTTYEARWFALQPVERWSNAYYTPVGEADPSAPVSVFLYNPAALGLDVDFETLATSGSLIVSAGGVIEFTMPADSGARFGGRLQLARDEFNAVAFDGSDGSIPWSDNWIEGGGELIGEGLGDIQVDTGTKCHGTNCLEIRAGDTQGAGIFVYREVDLTGAASATLTYDYEYDDKGGFLVLEASDDGGATWDPAPLVTYTFPAKVRGSESFDLTPYVAADTQIRFRVTGVSGSRLWVDNLQIATTGIPGSGGEPAAFYALSTIDYDSTTHDWGFSLVPGDFLSTAVMVGWAPGSSDLTENGAPVWVTAEADTTLFIDYDGNGISDASQALNRLQSLKVRDADNDQTGMRLFTTDGTRISAAWGQEPGVASTGSPAIDLGTTVLPFINPNLIKDAVLHVDQNGNGFAEAGDTLLYTLRVENVSPASLIDPLLVDSPDSNVTYVPNSSSIDGAPVADNPGPETPFPFDDPGYTMATIHPGGVVLVRYQMEINDPLPAELTEVVNDAVVTAADGSTSAASDAVVTVPALEISKVSDVVGAASPGQVITYTITVNNPSSVPQSDISVQDALPTGTSYMAQSTTATGPGPVTRDNIPGGASPDLLDGTPADLVLATDGFALNVGETLTVTYQVVVDDPIDRGIGRIVNTATAAGNNLADSVSATVVDLVMTGGRIGDLVWLDVDGDGVFDIGEPGIANVVVELLDGSCTQGLNCRTTTTSARGGYLFDRLAAGNYQVLVDETTLPGSAGDLLPAPGTANPNPVPALSIAGTEQYLQVDFGFAPAMTKMVIGDFVWSDADDDGIQDPGEVGIGGVTLELIDAASGLVVDTTTTGADGKYLFSVALEGKYRVRVTDTGGELSGYTLSSGPQSSASPSAPISVVEGSACLEADFGYYAPGLYSVSETVWLDADLDAAVGANETGLRGVTVLLVEDVNGDALWSAGEPVLATATTDTAGELSFSGLEPGDYLVVIEDSGAVLEGMAGTTVAGENYQLPFTAGPDHDAKSFGYSRPGSFGDRLWSDADGNGEQDAGEPGLGGVSVTLWRDDGDYVLDSTVDGLIGSTTTDAAGRYLFSGLDAGTYFASVDDGQAALAGSTPTTTDEETGGNATGTQIEGSLASELASFLIADFGYQDVSLADVSGTVFEDLDADGIDDGVGEPGFSGVTMALMDAGPDATFGTDDDLVVAEMTTDTSGDYLFSDVQGSIGAPRTYRVAVTDANGVLQDATLTSGLDELEIEVIGTDISSIDFGYRFDSTRGALGDLLWLDADRDGDRDPGEAGIVGVTVDLWSTGPDGAIGGGDDLLLATATTDAAGGYRFAGLVAGVYYVDVTDTAGVLAGLALTAGSSDPSTVIPLSEGEWSGDADFGYSSATGSLVGDTVWHDEDGNGFQGSGELGIESLTLRLWDPGANGIFGGGDDTLLDTTITDANGRYLFTGVSAGKVYVEIVTSGLPAGYSATPTNGPAVRPFDVQAGSDVLVADFGFSGATTGSIGDIVYFDADGDGSQAGSDEVGIEGVTVDLWRDPDGVFMNGDEVLVATTTTDADGEYDFVGLPAASYDVTVSDTHGNVAGLNGTQATVSAITITAAGEDVDTADFGFAPSGGTGAIGDIVWHDLDGDGLYDPQGADATSYTADDEWGVARVTVDLWLDENGNGTIEAGTDNLIRTTETDENGQYEFLGVPYGDYVVNITDANCVLDVDCDSSIHGDEWTQTAPVPPPAEIDAVTLSAGSASDFSADFGYTATVPYTINGTVFFDANGNGVLDPAETDVAGVRVILYRDLDGDGELDATDARMGAMDSTGAFSFSDLPDGDYLLVAETSGSFVDGMTQTTQQATAGIQPVTIAGANEAGNDFGFWVQTTSVLVSGFGAELGSRGVTVRWETASEAGTAGFYLYRWNEALGDYELVNAQLLPAAVGSPQGGVYELVDREARPGEAQRYALVEVEAGGAERTYGPFDVVATRAGSRFESERRVRGRVPVTVRDRARLKAAGERRATASDDAVRRPSDVAAPVGVQGLKTTRLKLEIVDSGLYWVGSSEIAAAMGIPESKVGMVLGGGRLRLSHRGERMPWRPWADGLLFYGESVTSPYTEQNVYWLDLGYGAAMASASAGGVATGETTSSPAAAEYEENAFAMTTVESVDADLYYWAYLSAGDATWGSFSTTLPVMDPVAGEAELTVHFQSMTSTPAVDEHRVRITLNGIDLGTTTWDGTAAHTDLLPVPSGVLVPGDNALEVTAELGSGVPYSVLLLDRVELSYPRLHRAVGERLALTVDFSETVSADGFSTADVVVVDVTDPLGPVWLEGVTVMPDSGGYRASFAAEDGQSYAVATGAGLMMPTVSRSTPDLAHDRRGAEYVVIAPEALLDGARALADYRTATGLVTTVVSLESIYDRFGEGLVTPEAMHDFLEFAWASWREQPRFVVLAGDGTFDYLNHQAQGDNLVPPRLVATPHGMFASDVLLGDVEGGDGIPEIAVGRIPAVTNAELISYVEKLSLYEGASAGVERLTMLADDPDPAGNFPADSDMLLTLVPETVAEERIYLSQLPLASARTATSEAFAVGTDWVNYLGHGGIDRLANEGLVLATDAPALAVGDRLPVVSSLTCSAGRFEVPGWTSVAEALVLEPAGGAAVVWAPAGQSYHFEALALNEALFAAIFGGTAETVGELVLETLATYDATPGFEYLPAIYNLVGDPAYRVR